MYVFRLFFPLAIAALAACGPNVFHAQGVVLNPTYVYPDASKEVPHTPRMLIVIRKETRVAAQNRIVGRYDLPPALRPFQEYAQIPDQRTDGDALYLNTRVFSNYRNEMDLEKDYGFVLELPDGRKIQGHVDRQLGLKDYSVSLTGAHMQTHMMVRDSSGLHAYRHVEEVQNDFELFSRTARVRFDARGLVAPATQFLVFVVRGYDREWRYRFDLTNDPDAAAQASIDKQP
jgi:hypothetical protein